MTVSLTASDARMVKTFDIMGTVVSVDARPPFGDEAAFTEFHQILDEADMRFSTYKADSEVNGVSDGRISLTAISADLAEVLALCERLRTESGGAFDVWRHSEDGRLDPSGLVKGWAAERAAAALSRHGFGNFAVSAGGDIAVRGVPEPGRRWRTGIRHPLLGDKLAAVVELSDCAIATSGLYERGAHIRDPRGAGVGEELLSMTVVHQSLALADSYATAAFVMGKRGLEWIAGIPGFEAFAVTGDGRSIWTQGFDPLLVRASQLS